MFEAETERAHTLAPPKTDKVPDRHEDAKQRSRTYVVQAKQTGLVSPAGRLA